MKKKISILALHLGYGGVEKAIVSLANSLVKLNKYKIEIVSIYRLYDKPVFDIDEKVKVTYLLSPKLNPNRKEWSEALHNLKLISLGKESLKSLKILYKRRKSMVDYIKNTDADVIISTRVFLNELLSEYGKDNTLKIGWEHNHYHDDMKYATDVIRSAKNLDYFVLVSKGLQKFYHKKMRTFKCKCIYIPNAIENIPKTKSPLTDEHLISVGRLSPEKGYLDLLKIYLDLKNKKCKWHLDIVGDGSERSKLERFIKENNLENDVTLHGFKNSKEIEKLMHKASIYVMTSYTESFGIVLLEAMSNGLPCIAFDSAEGAKEVITSGRDGYLIKHRNFKAMEKKILDLTKDIEIRKELGKNGRRKVKGYMSDNICASWENIIERK